MTYNNKVRMSLASKKVELGSDNIEEEEKLRSFRVGNPQSENNSLALSQGLLLKGKKIEGLTM